MQIELYHKQHCPYSGKVRDYIERTGLKSHIEYHDVENEPEADKELASITNKSQVPCLLADGEPIWESDKIIDWLNNTFEEEITS